MTAFRCSVAVFLVALSSCSAGGSNEVPDGGDADHAIAASLSFDDQDCIAKGLPVAITLTNNGDKPTRSVSWSFSAFKANHSTDLAAADWMLSSGDPNRSTDRIIQPGETFKTCSSSPQLQGTDVPQDLDYQVKANATF